MATLPDPMAVGDPVTAEWLNKIRAAAAEIFVTTITITPSAPNTATTGHVDFPAGLFSDIPMVFTDYHGGAPDVVSHGNNNADLDGVDIIIVRSNTTNTSIRVLAINVPS